MATVIRNRACGHGERFGIDPETSAIYDRNGLRLIGDPRATPCTSCREGYAWEGDVVTAEHRRQVLEGLREEADRLRDRLHAAEAAGDDVKAERLRVRLGWLQDTLA